MKEPTKSDIAERWGDRRRVGTVLWGGVVAAVLGMSGAGLAAFEPYRPCFLAGTASLLIRGFWQLDREEKSACELDRPCADALTRRRMRVTLWVATAIAVLFATFHRWRAFWFQRE